MLVHVCVFAVESFRKDGLSKFKVVGNSFKIDHGTSESYLISDEVLQIKLQKPYSIRKSREEQRQFPEILDDAKVHQKKTDRAVFNVSKSWGFLTFLSGL